MQETRRHLLKTGAAVALGGLGTATLQGCAGVPNTSASDTTASLVYGFIDMKDAPTRLDRVTIRCYSCKSGTDPDNWAWGEDGYFWDVLAPGSYQIESFMGIQRLLIFSGGKVIYRFGSDGRNESAIRIAQPGAYFMGAYRFVLNKGKGFFDAPTFSMESGAASEKAVLAKVIQQIDGQSEFKDHAHIKALARRRYAQL